MSAESCGSCAIKKLIYQYADHIDSGELGPLSEMFEHARIIGVTPDGDESVVEGQEGVLAMYQNFTRIYPKSGTPSTLHVTTNVIVDIDESGRSASSKSYAVVFQAVDALPLQPIIGVRYLDAFTKSGDQWRFTERKIISSLIGDLSQHLLTPMS
tara:strand:+ start:246 stop:710 length:465 start_codon:yes stop_codon:yes gene_type:complete